MAVAKRYADNLSRIKDNIKNSYDYFEKNCKRFHEFRKFIFDTSLSEDDINLLTSLQKPAIETNVLEAYISRLLGEFSKQEPDMEVGASPYAQNTPMLTQQIQLVEGYQRATLLKANNENFSYEVYKDLLSGGFSVAKVYTDYAHDMSMDQDIFIRRVYDPTLCGFDPLARLSHKGDGDYCFELFPMTEDEFKRDFPDVKTDKIRYTRTFGSFNWSYVTFDKEVMLVADYYEKKKKRVKLIQLSNGKVLTENQYTSYLEQWTNAGHIQQPAVPVGQSRWTTQTTICRYRLIESEILSYEETDYDYLPYVFFDGSSALLKDGTGGSVQQMTRPYPYHAKGIQRLKNFAIQTLANELENLVQHKWKAPKEGIPPEYLDSYINVQQAQTLIYNAFKNDDPNVPLPPPQEIQRTPIPPEVSNSIMLSDQVTQAILGSYDASLGINNNQLSGIAIVEGATQSNSAAMPYIVGYLQGLNQCAQIIKDLMPKYIVRPRTIPFVTKEGQKSYQQVNSDGSPSMQFNPLDIDIVVKAGLNFSVQQSKTLQQLIALTQASPMFAQFMATEGLTYLLDNVDIRQIEQIKLAANRWTQQMKMQQQQAQQMQQQMPNPAMIKMQVEQAKLQQNAQQTQVANQQKQAELMTTQYSAETDRMKTLGELQQSHQENMVKAAKTDAENMKTQAQLAMTATKDHRDHMMATEDMAHRHAHETARFLHDVISTQAQSQEQPQPQEETSNG